MSIKKSIYTFYTSNSFEKTIGNSSNQNFILSTPSVNLKNVSIYNINNKVLLLNSVKAFEYDNNVKDLTGLRSISSGKISYIYLGKTVEPDKEFLETANKEYLSNNTNSSINPDYFFPVDSGQCVKHFLFANVIAKRKDIGVTKFISNNDLKVPYSGNIPPPDSYFTKKKQSTFIFQDTLNDGKIYISGIEIIFENANLSSSGVPVVSDKVIDIDNWYNSNFKNKQLSENIGIGYLNDVDEDGNSIYSLGDRYNWSFGSIFFTLNISSKIGKNIIGESYDCCSPENSFSDSGDKSINNRLPEKILSGVEIKYIPSDSDEIRLKAWMFPVDNILTQTDEYNFKGVYWDETTILIGNKKYEVHIPQQLNLPTSEQPNIKDLFWISTNVLPNGEVPEAGINYVHHTVNSSCQIQQTSTLVQPYNPNSNENFYNFYGFSDYRYIRDIGFFYKTILKWEEQVYGKGIYEHYLRNIDAKHCTNLSIAPITQNILISDEGCFFCYYRKYIYCNTLKIKNIYFISKVKKYFINWEDRDTCDDPQAQEWQKSDYDYDDHSTMLIGPLNIVNETINNQVINHLYSDKDSLFLIYSAKGESDDCHELIVRKNTLTTQNETVFTFPVTSFTPNPPQYPQRCRTDDITYSSLNANNPNFFVKKGEKIRLYLKNYSNVKCIYGTSHSSYHDELHPISKKVAAEIKATPPGNFYSGGNEIYKPITYEIVSTNINSLSSFLFTENVREFVENNLQATIKLEGKFLNNQTELLINFPDHLYSPNTAKNFYLYFFEQIKDDKGNWILTYDVYQKINNNFNNGIRISSISYVKNSNNINHHIVFNDQETYDAIANNKIYLNINDFDLSCFSISSLSNNNIDSFLRNNYGLGIISKNVNGNEIASNLQTSNFDLLSIEFISSNNEIKVIYGFKDPYNAPHNNKPYDGLLEIILKKCIPNINENYIYLGELKIIVENTCEGIEYVPPEPEIVDFPDVLPPPSPFPSPPPQSKICYKITEFEYQRGDAQCNHIPKLYYVANDLSIKSIALSSSSPQQLLSQNITDSICHTDLWYKLGGWSEHTYLNCCHYKSLLYKKILHDTTNKFILYSSEDQCDIDYNDGYIKIKYQTCSDCQEGSFNIEVEDPPEMCYKITKIEYKRGEAWCKHQVYLYYYALINNNIIIKTEGITSAEGPGSQNQLISININDSICFTDIHRLYKLFGFSSTSWLACCYNKNLIYKFKTHDEINKKIIWDIEDQCDFDVNDATITVYYDVCSNVNKCSNVILPPIINHTNPGIVCFSLKRITYQKGEATCTHYPKITYKDSSGGYSTLVLTITGSGVAQEATFSIECGNCCFNVNYEDFINIINSIKAINSPSNASTNISFGDCFSISSNKSTPLSCCNEFLKYYCTEIKYYGQSILFYFYVEDGCDIDFNDAIVTVQLDVCIIQ